MTILFSKILWDENESSFILSVFHRWEARLSDLLKMRQ